jgi:hypothetical protein
MSLQAFQAALARLVTEPSFRDRVRTGEETDFDPALTERERRRLHAAAADPGLRVTATLVSSFRLGKILQLLPLTRQMLGDARLVQEARAFWRETPPRTYYSLEEAVQFCDYLLGTAGRGTFVKEVVAFERVQLELRRVRPEGEEAPPQEVFFRHDPRDVLGPLSEGRAPRQARRWFGRLRASLGPDGEVAWERIDDPRLAALTVEDPCLEAVAEA